MQSQILGLRVAGMVFGFMALGQLARLVLRPEVIVAGYPIPLLLSLPAFIFMGGLSLWMWKLSQTKP